jgi:hypothetical protein
MLKLMIIIVLGIVSLAASGFENGQRISRLEMQTQELTAEVKKFTAAGDYDFQAKCSRDAKGWFNEKWPRDKATILLDYTNHYQKASNKCFILVEYHYSMGPNGSWVNDMMLYDVYENAKYGNFGQHNFVYLKPEYHSESLLLTCELLGTKCKTIDQFNDLVRPYMND